MAANLLHVLHLQENRLRWVTLRQERRRGGRRLESSPRAG
jgi:hypothetical protein